MAFKVLVVEDDFIIQMFLENALKKIIECQIFFADNSEEGLEYAKQQNPDLILMDIGIGGSIDGVGVANVINQKYQIPIVFITGNSDSFTLQRIREVSPVHVIYKPIDEEKLVVELKGVVESLHVNVS